MALSVMRRSAVRLATTSFRSFSRASAFKSEEMSHFPGASSRYVNELCIDVTTSRDPAACYRIMNSSGEILNEKEFPSEITDDTILKWYRLMNTVNSMDYMLYNAQRQGRISFYMTNYGEEATHIGSAAALLPEDVIYAQYREAGVLLYRNFSLSNFMDQVYTNVNDLGKGRQMPVHYGSSALNFHTISSPLGTQLPQAAGAAYALKREGKGRCVICYFGDGAASEGDAHPAFNFSATLDCPVIFFCRNNGYAISTPTAEQYRGDGIISRAAGYGMDAIRVDGNDIFAVYNATMAARESCLKNNRPVLIEAMTYRIGHHSTSDDSSAYRGADEVDTFTKDTPIGRLAVYMRARGLWDDAKEVEMQKEIKAEVSKEFNAAEKRLKPPLSEMFTDVYDEKTPRMKDQEKEMVAHLAKYPDEYPRAHHAE